MTDLAPDVFPIALDDILASLHDRGVCVIPNAIDPGTLAEARSALDGILAREHEPRHDKAGAQRSFHIALKHPVFRRLVSHPLTVGIWQAYIAEDIMCSTWSSNTMLPGGGFMQWHADYPYWSMKTPWPKGILAGQSLWLLDDFTDENGGTAYVPGSHREVTGPDGDTQGPRPDQEIVEAPAGTLVVFDGRMWHSSRENRTDRTRSALLGMYLRPALIPQENMRQQLERLEDPTDLETQLFCGKQRTPNALDAVIDY